MNEMMKELNLIGLIPVIKIENPDDAVWLMQAVNSPNFRMYWQPNQFADLPTNIASAEVLVTALEAGSLNWRELVNPRSEYNMKNRKF